MRWSSAFLASRRLDPKALAQHPCRALIVDESDQVNFGHWNLDVFSRSGQFVIQGGDTAGESDQDLSACLVVHDLVEPRLDAVEIDLGDVAWIRLRCGS
jgi:hypothetical protein